VRDALVSQAKARERLEAESDAWRRLRTTLRSRASYQNGMTGSEVLGMQRNLLAASKNRIDALRAQRAAIRRSVQGARGVWS